MGSDEALPRPQTALVFAPAKPARQPNKRKPSSHADLPTLVRTLPCSIGLADCASNDAWCTEHPVLCRVCKADHADRDDAGKRATTDATWCTGCRLTWVEENTKCPGGCGGLTKEGSDVFGIGYTCSCARNAWIKSLRESGAL